MGPYPWDFLGRGALELGGIWGGGAIWPFLGDVRVRGFVGLKGFKHPDAREGMIVF
jgi:hypothetical protein